MGKKADSVLRRARQVLGKVERLLDDAGDRYVTQIEQENDELRRKVDDQADRLIALAEAHGKRDAKVADLQKRIAELEAYGDEVGRERNALKAQCEELARSNVKLGKRLSDVLARGIKSKAEVAEELGTCPVDDREGGGR